MEDCHDSRIQGTKAKLLTSGIGAYPSYLDPNQSRKGPEHDLRVATAKENRAMKTLIKRNKKQEEHVNAYLELDNQKIPYLSNKGYIPQIPMPLNYARAMQTVKQKAKENGNEVFRGKELHLPCKPDDFGGNSNLRISEINMSGSKQSRIGDLHQTRLYKNRIGKYIEMKKRNKTKDYINKRIEDN